MFVWGFITQNNHRAKFNWATSKESSYNVNLTSNIYSVLLYVRTRTSKLMLHNLKQNRHTSTNNRRIENNSTTTADQSLQLLSLDVQSPLD